MKDAPAIVVLTRSHYPFSNILLGLGIYLIGLLLSAIYGVTSFFLQMWLFALGCFGITWVSSFWVWAFRSLNNITEELHSNFEISNSEFALIKQRFMKRISSDKYGFLFSLPGYAFVAYHIWLVFSRQILLPVEVPKTLDGNVVFGFYAIILFSICVYLILASAHIFLQALLFLKKLTRFPIKIGILQLRRKVNLNKTTDAILIGTFSWYVGASLVMTIIFAYSSVVIISFLIFVIAIGLLFFFIPQILFHQSICRSKENMLKKIESEFKLYVNLPVSPECDSLKALLLCTLFDQVDKICEWPLDFGLLLQLFSSSLIPIATTIIGLLGK